MMLMVIGRYCVFSLCSCFSMLCFCGVVVGFCIRWVSLVMLELIFFWVLLIRLRLFFCLVVLLISVRLWVVMVCRFMVNCILESVLSLFLLMEVRKMMWLFRCEICCRLKLVMVISRISMVVKLRLRWWLIFRFFMIFFLVGVIGVKVFLFSWSLFFIGFFLNCLVKC